MKTDVVINVDKIIGVESDADAGNIIVDGGLCYRLDRSAAREVQEILDPQVNQAPFPTSYLEEQI
jgi:hypothetical protein